MELLELKLPFISEVNDPLECMPFFYCPNDKAAIERQYLLSVAHKNMCPSANYKQKLDVMFKNGEIQKNLVESQRQLHKEWNKSKGCLLSVSETAQEIVMWAHYTEAHKGVVIGIDFDNIFQSGIEMHHVKYSNRRPQINILDDPQYMTPLMTKSDSWAYEREFRAIFLVEALEDLQTQGLACLKNFKGSKTWFLRLNPKSIKKIIFGLYAGDSLKSGIKKLIERPELKHVELYHVETSETYTLNLVKEI